MLKIGKLIKSINKARILSNLLFFIPAVYIWSEVSQVSNTTLVIDFKRLFANLILKVADGLTSEPVVKSPTTIVINWSITFILPFVIGGFLLFRWQFKKAKTRMIAAKQIVKMVDQSSLKSDKIMNMWVYVDTTFKLILYSYLMLYLSLFICEPLFMLSIIVGIWVYRVFLDINEYLLGRRG